MPLFRQRLTTSPRRQGTPRTRTRSRCRDDRGSLERRSLLSSVLPTNLEQYMLELMNRAANPAGELRGSGST